MEEGVSECGSKQVVCHLSDCAIRNRLRRNCRVDVRKEGCLLPEVLGKAVKYDQVGFPTKNRGAYPASVPQRRRHLVAVDGQSPHLLWPHLTPSILFGFSQIGQISPHHRGQCCRFYAFGLDIL